MTGDSVIISVDGVFGVRVAIGDGGYASNIIHDM